VDDIILVKREMKGGENMIDVRIVAQYFLYKASMSHKKLEKLCYYAQAWYLANHDKPLMPNRFEAWVHGPVSPDLYSQYADWGWIDIPKREKSPEICDSKKSFLDQVFDVYGGYTADDLEAMTHKEEPWKKAREGLLPSEYSRRPISMKIMRDYYGERIGKTYAK
jgi:uncharacterized phage-associated protein